MIRDVAPDPLKLLGFLLSLLAIPVTRQLPPIVIPEPPRCQIGPR